MWCALLQKGAGAGALRLQRPWHFGMPLASKTVSFQATQLHKIRQKESPSKNMLQVIRSHLYYHNRVLTMSNSLVLSVFYIKGPISST